MRTKKGRTEKVLQEYSVHKEQQNQGANSLHKGSVSTKVQ